MEIHKLFNISLGSMEKRHGKSILLLLTGQTVSEIGNAFGYLALIALVYKWTNSVMDVGLLLALKAACRVILSPLSGALSDRLTKKNILIASDMLRFLFTLAILFSRNIAVTYVCIMIISISEIFFRPALTTLIAELVSKENLLRLTAFFDVSYNFVSIIGPLLAGIVISATSPELCVLADALTFLFSAISLLFVASQRRISSARRAVGDGIFRGLREALREGPLGLMLVDFLFGLTGGAVNILLIALVKGFGTRYEANLGQVYSGIAVGFLVGALFVASKLQKRIAPRLSLIIALSLVAIVDIVWAMSKGTEVAVVVGIVNGIANSLFSLNYNALLLVSTPRRFRGRVIGINSSIGSAAVAISMSMAALLVEKVPIQSLFCFASALCILPMIPAVLIRASTKTAEE